jgi:hypothetical protein
MTVGGTFPTITPQGEVTYWVFLAIQAKMQTQNIFATVVGPMTAAQYNAKYGNPNNGVNPPGGFTNKLAAQQAANQYNANPGQAGGVNAPGAAPGINAPNPFGTNPLTGITAIGDFFQRLTQPQTWVRIAEFAAGGLLLYIGGNALLRGTAASEAAQNTVSAGKKAVKIGKAVAK